MWRNLAKNFGRVGSEKLGIIPLDKRSYTVDATTAPGTDGWNHPDIFVEVCSQSHCLSQDCGGQTCGPVIYEKRIGNLTHKPFFSNRDSTIQTKQGTYAVISSEDECQDFRPGKFAGDSLNGAVVKVHADEIEDIIKK